MKVRDFFVVTALTVGASGMSFGALRLGAPFADGVARPQTGTARSRCRTTPSANGAPSLSAPKDIPDAPTVSAVTSNTLRILIFPTRPSFT